MYIATFQASGATCLANGTWSHKLDCEEGLVLCLCLKELTIHMNVLVGRKKIRNNLDKTA
jgi:hypothetical protein